MNFYRDYYLKDINKELVDKKITVSGWVNRSRDHGNLSIPPWGIENGL